MHVAASNYSGETEEVNKSMVEGEILYSVSVFATKYFFGRHLESFSMGAAKLSNEHTGESLRIVI